MFKISKLKQKSNLWNQKSPLKIKNQRLLSFNSKNQSLLLCKKLMR